MALLLICGAATAGGISEGLQTILDLTDETTPVKAMIFLSKQVDIQSLDLALHQAKAGRGFRHARVITELQDLASATQGDLLATLDSEMSAGRVVGYTPHWLVNGVVVVAIKAALYDLAQRSDVDIIEADLVPALIEPVSIDTVPGGSPHQGIGITPGVVAVGARRVWDELGVRGEGALVGTLDWGVDGSHPALAARWRGNSAPWHHAWLDLQGTDTQFPSVGYGEWHGTHVMGTITGLAPEDTIGVAPEAEWIACNAIYLGAGSDMDNAVLAALAWFADPDGDPATVDDVPDVVQNSWGVLEGFTDYIDCDSRWWTAIDACEAAGVVLTWSAGNEGPVSTSLRSPADRATNIYNTFSVGSTIHSPPFTISYFSSRGPAGPTCGHPYNLMK
ncbi:MAG: S8 family serine peptidase, partial [Candidatus Krumholzibacteriia bacterium]